MVEYLLDIHTALHIFLFLTFFIGTIAAMDLADDGLKKASRFTMIIALIALFGLVFVPSKEYLRKNYTETTESPQNCEAKDD